MAVVHFDDAPVDSKLVQGLANIVAYRGPDASAVYCSGALGLAHHLMRVTRSCAEDAQPLVSTAGQFALVCDARFDQRRLLINALRGHGVVVSERSPNSRLLLEALQLWGEAALDRIKGDYSFVFFDQARRRVIAAVDPFGLRTLFYGTFENGLVISNDPLPVLAHPALDVALDRTALADFLMTGRVGGIDPAATPFRLVRQLVGGHRIRLDVDSGKTDIRRHWQFPIQSKALYYSSLEDYGEHFRCVLKEAVSDRIDAPSVVAPMSGGMDSTTVVVTAAELIAGGSGPDLFTAVTAVQHDQDPEGLLAAEVCRAAGVPHHKIVASPGRPLAAWRCMPFPATDFFDLYENNQRVSSQFGRLSINASSADYALCPEPFSILGQLRASGLRDTWRALRIMKSQYRFRPRFGSGLYSWLRRTPIVNPYTRPPYPYPDWLSSDLERDLELRERWAAHWSRWPSPQHPLRPTAHRMITAKGRLSMHSVGWPLDFALPAPADPFLDQRMIEFLWSLPPLPWFYDKHLTRTAMRGWLPDSVVDRPKTPARRWLPSATRDGVDFSWDPGGLILELVDRSRLRELNDDGASAADFHPMFLNRWLTSFEAVFEQMTGKKCQLTV